MGLSLTQIIELYHGGKHEEIEMLCRKHLQPGLPEPFLWHLAAANAMQLGDLATAHLRVKCAIALRPEEVNFYNTQGTILRQLGQFDEADASYKKALQLDSANLDTRYNLANLHRDRGNITEAIACYQSVLAAQAGYHTARQNLAELYQQMGNYAAAEAQFRTLIELGGNSLQVMLGLGRSMIHQARYQEAESCFRAMIQAAPDDPLNATYYLGNALLSQGKISEAEACHRAVVARLPDYYQAWNNLGNDLRDQGRQQEALACYRKAIELQPDYMRAHSNLLFELNCILTDGKTLLDEHVKWDQRHGRSLLQHQRFSNQKNADRPLRIGYVSPDFCNHSVAYFIEGILKHHNPEMYHVTCYSNLLKPDEKTETLRKLAHQWREIGRLSDDDAADLIREDQIDILVDLSGHTANHRLQLFARKPAPIQVTYLGYPATTGMQAMDYRISDHLADPAYSDDYHSEKVIRLPRCFIAFTPAEKSRDISALPVSEGDDIRFVSFNHLAKIGPDLIRLWSEVLHAVPNSTLMVKHFSFQDEGVRHRFMKQFAVHGITAERLEILTWAESSEAHLRLYQRADIALDSFPYHGTTTTCEALWMGVPVITLAGKLHAGRVGASLLNSMGLDELIAEREDDYVTIASDLANDHVRLQQIRSTLRQRMMDSGLCDASGLTAELEHAFRSMWEQWLRRESEY